MKYFWFLIIVLFGIIPVWASDNRETLIILDQSASMLEFYNGVPKIEYAKRAVKAILESLPDDEKVGFRTIGVHPIVMFQLIAQNPNALCEATMLHNEILENNKKNINASLSGIMPSGASPLQYTLQLAIDNDFYLSTKEKHIILVTDGYENCDGDPCRYIRRAMMQRDDLKIDIVAIGVKDDEKSLLGCLTDAANGKFLEVESIADIQPKINQVIPNSPDYSMKNVQAKNNFSTFNKQVLSKPNYNSGSGIQYKSYLLEFYE